MIAIVLLSTLLPVWLAVQPAALQLPPPAAASQATALVVKFADGRTTNNLVRSSQSKFWTPLFPRTDPRPAGQAPLDALQFSYVLLGTDVRVAVSVLRRTSQPEETPVATVFVKPGQHIVVSQLREVGAEPVDLSLAPIAPAVANEPAVISEASSLRLVKVETNADGNLSYRVTLENDSPMAARSIYIDAYRAGKLTLSARRAGPEGRPFIPAGAIVTVSIPSPVRAGPGGAVHAPLDLISISSVLWSDQSSEGNPVHAAESRVSDNGDRLQFERIVPAMKQAVAEATIDANSAMARLKAAITALPIDVSDEAIADEDARSPLGGVLTTANIASLLKVSLRAIKNGVLGDLRKFDEDRASRPDTPSPHDWLAAATGRYEAWLARLAVR